MSKNDDSDQLKSIPWKLILGFLFLAGLFASYFIFDGKALLEQFIEWIKSLGVWGPIVFIVAYIILTVFMIPGSVLTLGAGFAFGLGWGSLWAAIGANLGANLAFLIGRYFAREKIQEKVTGNEKFEAVDKAVESEGWKIVALTRLAPVFPFTLLNYLYSVTGVKWVAYATATLIAMLPGTVMYVYLGSIGRFAAEGGGAEKTTGEKIFFFVGLIAIVAITVYITKIGKKALASKTDIDTGGEPDSSSDSE
ncbi:MAG: TVP38/TMEM64 family protein [Verrucomicrobiales bacterium]